MKDSDMEFPGFHTCVHKDELLLRRPRSRLQRKAPCPLQLKSTVSLECNRASKSMVCSLNSSSSPAPSSASSFMNSFYHGTKDPIPLLSPLVLPSLLEPHYTEEKSNARSL
ncbi:hypothetical protein AAG906_002046 [Vitis piasezkii]